MKANAIYVMTIILFLLWCSGCSQRVPPKSGFEVETVNPPTTNTNNMNAKTNQDRKAEWKAYRSILTGDFTLINKDDDKSEMEYIYKIDSQNGKCEWKYILMDFNKDGCDELFIQLSPDHDSALFSYKDGKIKCIYIDDIEMNCFTEPLKGGKLLETYDHAIAPNKTIFELGSEFSYINAKLYTSMTVDNYENYKENYSVIMDQYPSIVKEGVYYFQEIGGKATELPKKDWEQIQKDISEKIIPDSEWKDCSDIG